MELLCTSGSIMLLHYSQWTEIYRYVSTTWASTDWLDFAFCALNMLLKMQSLWSVNVISQDFLWKLFDKYNRINDYSPLGIDLGMGNLQYPTGQNVSSELMFMEFATAKNHEILNPLNNSSNRLCAWKQHWRCVKLVCKCSPNRPCDFKSDYKCNALWLSYRATYTTAQKILRSFANHVFCEYREIFVPCNLSSCRVSSEKYNLRCFLHILDNLALSAKTILNTLSIIIFHWIKLMKG